MSTRRSLPFEKVMNTRKEMEKIQSKRYEDTREKEINYNITNQ
jgi:hypothetical protein